MTAELQALFSACSTAGAIACGTGKVGRFVIPYLAQKVGLLGVTNSRIAGDDAGTFLNTGLPLRSVGAWHARQPDAVIVITTTNHRFQDELIGLCKEHGFQKFFRITEDLENAMLTDRFSACLPPEKLAFAERLLPRIEAYCQEWMCYANEIRDTHQKSFAEFRGRHRGQSIVIVGAGPSVNAYSQIVGIPHIGVNSVFLKDGLTLDYYFAQDYSERSPWYQQLKDYPFEKFFGILGCHSREISDMYRIPESIIEENQGRRYFLQEPWESVHFDIEHHALMDYGSVAFAAFHFALYTMPRRIFLVGCDCSNAGHYDGVSGGDLQYMVNGWQKVKSFVTRYYPGVEVVSVNPVGLKGLFRDVYTEPYLDAHPEINRPAVFRPEELQE